MFEVIPFTSAGTALFLCAIMFFFGFCTRVILED